VAGELVDLCLVEVGDRRDRPADVAVERAVALGHLGLVAVVGEHDAAALCGTQLRGEPRQEPAAAVAGLDVLVDEAPDRSPRELLDLPAGDVRCLVDRRHEITDPEPLGQLRRKAARRP
jgi:hypothetical protein